MKRLFDVLFLSVVLALFTLVMWTGYLAIDAIWGPDPPIVIAGTIEHPRPRTYQVMPGDSLWSIAAAHYPGHHTGEMVYEIRVLNGLRDATIYPNQVLELPEVSQ